MRYFKGLYDWDMSGLIDLMIGLSIELNDRVFLRGGWGRMILGLDFGGGFELNLGET